MWVEQWSEKHQRPYFYNKQTKKTAWKGHKSTADFYDELVRSKPGRVDTTLLSMREHNRFVKSVLMHLAMIVAIGKWPELVELKALGLSLSSLSVWEKPRLRVLDVGCGDGSDLRRWTYDDRERWVSALHGFDVSAQCIGAARENTKNWKTIMGFPQDVDIQYKVHDARKKAEWANMFGTTKPYDIVSCMYCLPYFFSSQKVAKVFFQQAAAACRSGGALLALYPSEEELASHMWSINRDRMHIKLPQWYALQAKGPAPRTGANAPRPPLPYTLRLAGAVPNAVEYTVPKAALLQVARAAGFRVVLHKGVQAFAYAQGLWRLPYAEAYAASKVCNVLLCVKK